jgi:3'-5' exoribonuclease
MLRLAKALVDIHPWLDGDLLVAGVIIHDLGKLAEMQSDAAGLAADYTVEGRLIGHIVRGAIDIARVAERVGADPEKTVLLQHLVLSHHGKLEFGSPVLPKIPEAEALSVIDVLDARLFEMRDALAGVEPGGFSAKVWCLDNRELYRVRPR